MKMKKNNYHITKIVFSFVMLFLAMGFQKSWAQTFCIQPGVDQITGVQDGYRYELWNQNSQGNACMTLGEGALFSGEWSGIENYLARRGLGYDQTQQHEEIGRFTSNYNCDYNPTTASGNSYLSIYGWTVEPLIEFYIVEDWRNWIPSMASGVVSKGTITVDGSTYDIYENTRTNQPSIVGTATFQQYFSIRRDERNSGSIDISQHFDKWEELGMEMGKMHEVSFVVEGYQSTGDFEFTALDVLVNDDPVLGIETLESSEFMIVYPNPNAGNVSIQFQERIKLANVKIYDALGKMIFSREINNNNQIEVTNLDSGMYVVDVMVDGVNHKTKFLVR